MKLFCQSPASLLIWIHRRWALLFCCLHVLNVKLPPDRFRWSTRICFSLMVILSVRISLYLLLPIKPSAIMRIIKIAAPKIIAIFKVVSCFSRLLFWTCCSFVCICSFICFKRLNLDCSKAWYWSSCFSICCELFCRFCANFSSDCWIAVAVILALGVVCSVISCVLLLEFGFYGAIQRSTRINCGRHLL